MADFIVHTETEDFNYRGEDSHYTFNDAGLLVVNDGSKRRIFSPNAWIYLEESSPKPMAY